MIIKKPGEVYLMGCKASGCIKIGFTSMGVELRLKQLKAGNPNLYLISSYKTVLGNAPELRLHKIYRDYHVSGEWFRLEAKDVLKIHLIMTGQLDYDVTGKYILNDEVYYYN